MNGGETILAFLWLNIVTFECVLWPGQWYIWKRFSSDSLPSYIYMVKLPCVIFADFVRGCTIPSMNISKSSSSGMTSCSYWPPTAMLFLTCRGVNISGQTKDDVLLGK